MRYADLHCHLLWGIDDGAKTPEESLEMARALVQLGFDAVAPSPHARPEYPGADPVTARRAEVQALLDAQKVPLLLHPGAEHLFDEDFVANTPPRRPINAGKYVLVEAPYVGSIPGLPELCFRLKLKGVRVVIAHPERCAQFEQKGQAQAVAQVAALQLDIGSLIGRYGRTAKKLADQFLKEGLYAIGATDLHSPVGALDWVGRSLDELARQGGKDTRERLMARNPHHILAGEELELP
jgi:protein-tyrosine phosphatase